VFEIDGKRKGEEEKERRGAEKLTVENL